MNDEQLLRYSRQILMPEIDIEGQAAWLSANVLIVGAGGLGSPVALYLAAAGVGQLCLVDDDHVELSNLQRQIIHTQSRVGQSKVSSAQAAIADINTDVTVETYEQRLDAELLAKLLPDVDAIVDCSDNFSTRFMLNRASVEYQKPLISGAAIRLEGQVSVFNPQDASSPCYECLYKPGGDDEGLTCSESGVLAPLVGIIGSVQALETLKVLAGVGEALTGRLLLLDAKSMQWRTLKLKKDPECGCCASI